MPFKIDANFIDNFKIGDNINYNLEILSVLYVNYEHHSDGIKLIKPIVLINTSIAEALLYDFIENRIRHANKTEKILENVAHQLNLLVIDKFATYIDQAKKYDFFEMKDTKFYEIMHSLRQKRNRIHIQNTKHELPANESEIFDEKSKSQSEKVVEKILNTLTTKYPRREEYHRYVNGFQLPWDRHFK